MIERPRGTRDFNTQDMVKRRFIEQIFKKTFESFGYQEIQTPTFEQLELFTMKSGDSIIDELYAFTDKGGRQLALRPELTAPVIRMYIDQYQMTSKPLKLFYFGNCYRYDRPQKGRYREFMQAGCELIGTNTPEALSELIALAYYLFHNSNLQNFTIDIGNLQLLKLIFQEFDISPKVQQIIIPLIDKESYDEVTKELEKGDLKNDKITQFLNIMQKGSISTLKSFFSNNDKALEEIGKLEQIMYYLKNCFQISDSNLNLGIVRGLDYYTGIVFEIKVPKLGAEKQVCGGGEYELISLFKGRATPTSGFAIGFDRTLLSMEIENVSFPSQKLDYYIIPVSDDMREIAFALAMKLRKNQKKVDIDLMRRGIGKAMKYASSRDTENVLIVGPDEVKQNAVTLRDMNTGNQQLISMDTLKPL